MHEQAGRGRSDAFAFSQLALSNPLIQLPAFLLLTHVARRYFRPATSAEPALLGSFSFEEFV